MMKRGVSAALVAMFAAGAVRAQDNAPFVRVDEKGETVTVDLGALKGFLEQEPADASGFAVQYGGQDVERADKEAWKVEVAGVTPGDANSIVISCDTPVFKLTLGLKVADKRRAEAGGANCFTQDAAWASVCDTGEGKWKQKTSDTRFGVFADGPAVTLDGVEVSAFTPLAKGVKGSFYLVPEKKLRAWLEVAQKCYDALLKEDWATYVSCFTRLQQSQADKNADCRTWWNSVRKTIEKNSIEKFVFNKIRTTGSTESSKGLLFKRMNDDNEQVGIDTLLGVVIEDGKWKVSMVSP